MKKLFLAVIILTLAGLGTLIAAPHVLFAKYSGLIMEKIAEETGYRLAPEGDIAIAAFPSLELKLPAFSLYVRGEGGKETLLGKAQGAELALDTVRALTKREIAVSRVTLQAPDFSLKQRKDGSWNAVPFTEKAPAGKPAAGDNTHTLERKTGLRVENVRLDSIKITGASFAITPAKGKPVTVTGLDLETGYSLQPDFQAFSMKAADVTVDGASAGAVSLTGKYLFSYPKAALKETVLRMKSQVFSGSISADLQAKPVKITADLSAPEINLPAFGAAPKAEAAPPLSADKKGDGNNAQASPAPSLPDMSAALFTISVKTDALTVREGVRFAPAEFTLLNTEGAPEARIARAGFAEGMISGVFAFPKAGNGLAVNADITAQDMKAEAFPAALLPEKLPFSGTLGLSAKARTRGADTNALLKNLNGTLGVNAKDGKIPHNNFIRTLTAGKTLLRSLRSDEAAAELAAGDRAEESGKALIFTDAGALFDITQGVFRTDDLTVNSTFAKLEGKGDINIPAKTLDMRFTAVVPEVKHSEQAAKFVPVRVSGPLASPEVAPDVAGGIGEALKNPEAAKNLMKTIIEDSGSLDDKAKAAIKSLRDSFGGGKRPADAGAAADPAPAEEQKKPAGAVRDAVDSLLGTFGR